jgi:outer membrane receptor protein involved in Fe transport
LFVKSLDIKKDSDGIVDAISAEDIGKFPDSNLATAMERIPGVTVSRQAVSLTGTGGTSSGGGSTQITVRGFGPQFNETLFDGREVPTAIGNTGRGFDFGSVGSDFVGQVDVLKTPDASLSSGAIGATVNIKYPKPLDHPGMQLAGSLSGDENTGQNQVKPNAGLLFSDTFADDRIGILVDGAYADSEVRGNHVNIQGWEGGNPASGSGLASGEDSELQNIVSLSSVYSRLAEQGFRVATPRGLMRLQPAARLIVDRWIDDSAAALVNSFVAINCLINPEAILIGGRLPAPLVDRLAASLNERMAAFAPEIPAIAPAARAMTSDDAPAVGAAILPFSYRLLPTRFALLKTN